MELPRMRVRPKSTQTTTVFRGLERRPGAGVGKWLDERNLSADQFPRMSVRKKRAAATNIDGNNVSAGVAAICGGDHPVILDSMAVLWCSGMHLDLADYYDRETAWKIWTAERQVGAQFSPESGADDDGSSLGGLVEELGARSNQTITFRVSAVDENGAPAAWEYDVNGDMEPVNLSDYGITVTPDGPLYVGWKFFVDLWVQYSCARNTQMVRMAAYVLILRNGAPYIWVNAADLAAGDLMVEGENYGPVEGRIYNDDSLTLTLTLCDNEGEPYNGVTVSTSEPATQSGYWLDTSGKPVLREWNYLTTAWVKVSSTFVKVENYQHSSSNGKWDNIRAGDTVQLITELNMDPEPDGIFELLNSNHYIYKADVQSSEGWIMISGILPSDSLTVDILHSYAARRVPSFDFITEAQNRLWGCRYDVVEGINEIYASKLGDFRNWNVFQGLSTDSWTASRGTAAPYTGAITLNGNPLFFREESLEKVIPSSAGAHQIATYSLDGVQQGSSASMVIIDERLYYKSRMGVCVYSGTVPTLISEPFGDWMFSEASAARHRKKYCISMTRNDGVRVCAVFDLATGDWHMEDESWDGFAITWDDNLLYYTGGIESWADNLFRFDGSDSSGVEWYAETDDISHDLPEHKWITYLRLRFKLELGAAARVYISYDDGPWLRKGTLHGNRLHSQELGIWPRRCDHFRLRLEGCGGCELQSISYRMERSEGGH